MANGLGKKFFAWTLRKGDQYNHKLYGDLKKSLFSNLSGKILEIGPGSGVNFKYLPDAIEWIGIEPNPNFHKHLYALAKEKNIQATVLTGDASKIDVPDNSADVVIGTLVLCSVGDPAKSIAEIKRVLKPGGKYVYIEHTLAHEESRLRAFQNFSNPLNKLMADGCNCNRATWLDIENAGFSSVQLSKFRINAALKLHSPHIKGIAIK